MLAGPRTEAAAGAALACIALTLLPACGPTVVSLDGLGNRDELQAASEHVDVGDLTLTLKAGLWRNMMPGAGLPNDSSLSAQIEIAAVLNLAPLPSDLEVVEIYVIHGQQVWVTGFAKDAESSDLAHLAGTVRGGPKWDVGSTADLVVELRDAQALRHYLGARGLIIAGPE
jgi:hypothetical protein